MTDSETASQKNGSAPTATSVSGQAIGSSTPSLSANHDLSSGSEQSGRIRIRLHLQVTIAWLLGLFTAWAAELFFVGVAVAGVAFLLSAVWKTGQQETSFARFSLLLAVACAGICRWELVADSGGLSFAIDQQELTGTFEGRISSVPVVYRRPESVWSASYGSPERTTFDLTVHATATRPRREIQETWRVTVDGSLRGHLACGDLVSVQGRATIPESASNPGQFDYRQHLNSLGVTRQLFVNHFSAIQVRQKASWWSVMKWASWLRADAERVLDENLAGTDLQLAVAMFLGNRSQLPHELRDAFVASGAMHLLAISGLHVGILSWFLLKLANVIGVSRSRSLWFMMAVVTTYAMVTGFRPSVVRATVFMLLFGWGQLLGRQPTLVDLISMTALVMTILKPQLLIDSGAWLSFLSVAALAWHACVGNSEEVDRDAPLDSPILRERLLAFANGIRQQLTLRYGQMLMILAFTLPLTASQFHVLSPISLVINVLLIFYTFLVLVFGYVTLAVGILVPIAASGPASMFSWLLAGFSGVVNWAAEVRYGHLFLSDFPAWVLPIWYAGLLGLITSRTPRLRRGFSCLLVVTASGGLLFATAEPSDQPLSLTVLNIGHGSACVIENGDQVILVDAGSFNQSRRAAEIVSEFLWTQGWNHIDAIVISHADSDHYNAVPMLIRRFPVGQILTSREFVSSTDELVQMLLERIHDLDIPLRTAAGESKLAVGAASLQILQPDTALLPSDVSDNETSLVVRVSDSDCSILLPGDIEKRGLEQLLPKMQPVDLLVSPHHGSRFSNPPELAATLRPQLVIVSARDTSSRVHLEQIYAGSNAVWWTSEAGAVHVDVSKKTARSFSGCIYSFAVPNRTDIAP